MTNSTVRNRKTKPEKPRSDFPLYAHASGKWAKTIKGKAYYFGSWDDPEGALREYLEQKDELSLGKAPVNRESIVTVAELCNNFRRWCKDRISTGEMTQRTLDDYTAVTDRMVRVWGKTKSVQSLKGSDFAKMRTDIAEGSNLTTLGSMIVKVRRVLNHGVKTLRLPNPNYDGQFDLPNPKAIERENGQKPEKFFPADQCRMILNNAKTPELKAMILLALNCGFGNNDLAQLTLDRFRPDSGFIEFPRPKTGQRRRCPLWHETVEALQEVLRRRERREDLAIRKGSDTSRLFLTKYGYTYDQQTTSITNEFAKLLKELKLQRKGIGFYALRHTFRTIADESLDFPAARLIMGHKDSSMDGVYVSRIDDGRLRAVTDHVHAWLYGEEDQGNE